MPITRSGHGRAARRRPAPPGPDRRRRPRLRSRCGSRGLPLCEHAHGRLPRPPRPRHDPDLRHARRPRRRRRGGAPTSCCACRATSTSPPPRTATRPSSSTPSRPARCATRSSAPTPCSTSGASRSRTWSRTRVDVDRRIALDVRLPAHRLLPAALVAPEKQIVVTAVCGARPLAEGRPPMGIVCAQQDVARVYPLPDDPERCLEDFLELAAEHARRDGRAARPPGGVGPALPRALRRRLPRRPAEPASLRAVGHTGAPCAAPRVLIADRLRRLRLPRHLVPARPRADRRRARSARGCSTSLRARGARRRRRGARAHAGVRGRARVRARDPRRGSRSSSAPARSRSCSYGPSVQVTLTRRDRHRPRGLARRRRRRPVVQCVQRAPRRAR